MKCDFTLLFPPVIQFGWGCRDQLPDILSNVAIDGRTLVVASQSVLDSGMLKNAITAGPVFTGVPHDPPLETVDAIAEMARGVSATAIVAIGGGSIIDAAKAAAAIACAADPVSVYFHGEKAVPEKTLPLVALPTTAGTGAEITKNAVLSDPVTAVKQSLRSPQMVPAVALVDPELTVSMSPGLTAASGLDALTQAVESFISLNAHVASRALAREAVMLLMRWLPTACSQPTNVEARNRVAEGSLLSAMAFSQSGLGAVHGLAHPIGLDLDLAHGMTCAILLPHVLRWNLPVAEEDLNLLAADAGVSGANAFVPMIAELCASLGIPADFAEAGLKKEYFEHIIANCRSGSMKANPRPMSDDDVREMLSELV